MTRKREHSDGDDAAASGRRTRARHSAVPPPAVQRSVEAASDAASRQPTVAAPASASAPQMPPSSVAGDAKLISSSTASSVSRPAPSAAAAAAAAAAPAVTALAPTPAPTPTPTPTPTPAPAADSTPTSLVASVSATSNGLPAPSAAAGSASGRRPAQGRPSAPAAAARPSVMFTPPSTPNPSLLAAAVPGSGATMSPGGLVSSSASSSTAPPSLGPMSSTSSSSSIVSAASSCLPSSAASAATSAATSAGAGATSTAVPIASSAASPSQLTSAATAATDEGNAKSLRTWIAEGRPSRLSPPAKLAGLADLSEVWAGMVQREPMYLPDPLYLAHHPQMRPRMRSMLIDWINEVCEEFHLHRETFFMAANFIDRYLSVTDNIKKHKIQLVGVTCLFIASKIQEIYPPELSTFATVTDGACNELDILRKELDILEGLNWKLTPVTPLQWAKVFMQCLAHPRNTRSLFDKPLHCKHLLPKITQVLDLCILDLASLRFSPSVLAASVMVLLIRDFDVLGVTGYSRSQLQACLDWMSEFAAVAARHPCKPMVPIKQVEPSDQHNIQMHTTSLDLLVEAQAGLRPVLLTPPPGPTTTYRNFCSYSVTLKKQC